MLNVQSGEDWRKCLHYIRTAEDVTFLLIALYTGDRMNVGVHWVVGKSPVNLKCITPNRKHQNEKLRQQRNDIPFSFFFSLCLCFTCFGVITLKVEKRACVHYFSFLILTFKLKEHYLLTLPVTCHRVTSIIHFLLSKKAQTAILGLKSTRPSRSKLMKVFQSSIFFHS